MHKQNEGARAPSKRLKNDIFLIAVLLLAALLYKPMKPYFAGNDILR